MAIIQLLANFINEPIPLGKAQAFSASSEEDRQKLLDKIQRAIELLAEETTLPYPDPIDFTISPNEYSNLFAYNRSFAKLFENDLDIYQKIGSYGSILSWDPAQVYYRGNRVCYNRDLLNTTGSQIKVYVCLKDNIQNVIPDKTNTCVYSDSLYYNTLPDNIIWAEEIADLETFNISTNNIPLSAYNELPIIELGNFSFTDNRNVEKVESVLGTINTTLQNPNVNFNWVSNWVSSYNDITMTPVSASAVSNKIYYLDPSEAQVSIRSLSGANDYIVSTILENTDTRKSYARIWKSGFVEQGGYEQFDIALSDMVFADSTYLIGPSPSATVCIKHAINPILTDNIETITTIADICKVSWVGPSSMVSTYTTTEPSSYVVSNFAYTVNNGAMSSNFITAVTVTTEVSAEASATLSSFAEIIDHYIYNVEISYGSEKLVDGHLEYSNPMLYFSGVCLSPSGENLPVNMIERITDPILSGKTSFTWESIGVLRTPTVD